jgi:hypothetical protein
VWQLKRARDSKMNELFAKNCQRVMLRISFAFLFVLLTACAGGPNAQNELVYHGFEFNTRDDSPDVVLLDYHYGLSSNPVVANRAGEGKSRQSGGTSGDIRRGDHLYVKWRLKDTGKVYEDRVDLKSRLPRNIKRQNIYFIIDGAQLYVYLISFDPVRDYLTKDEAEADKSAMQKTRYKNLHSYARNDVVQIYPERFVIYPYKSVK